MVESDNYVYHYLGINYEDGEEVVKWHNTRVAADEIQANQILTNMSLAFGSKVGCITMLTDDEYKQWKEDRGYDPDKLIQTKPGLWRKKK